MKLQFFRKRPLHQSRGNANWMGQDSTTVPDGDIHSTDMENSKKNPRESLDGDTHVHSATRDVAV